MQKEDKNKIIHYVHNLLTLRKIWLFLGILFSAASSIVLANFVTFMGTHPPSHFSWISFVFFSFLLQRNNAFQNKNLIKNLSFYKS